MISLGHQMGVPLLYWLSQDNVKKTHRCFGMLILVPLDARYSNCGQYAEIGLRKLR